MRRRAFIALLSMVAIVTLAIAGLAGATFAFIGYYDTWASENMKEFLDAQGAVTTVIQLCDVGTTDLSSYDLLIVGPDTGYYGEWGNEAGRDAIRALDVPVLGMSAGGASLFEQLGLEINWGATASSEDPGETTIIVERADHEVFHTPIDLSVTDGDSLQLYDEPCPVYILYVPRLAEGPETLGRLPDTFDYAPVAIQGKYALWGFEFAPYGMTEAGKNLLINLITYLLGVVE